MRSYRVATRFHHFNTGGKAAAFISLFSMAIISLVIVGTAIAAQWNNFGGTCNSDGTWYTSSKVRHVTTPNDTIKAYLNDNCSRGLYLMVVNARNGKKFGQTVHFPVIGQTKVIATEVLDGTIFRNKFRKSGSKSGDDDKWDGKEYY